MRMNERAIFRELNKGLGMRYPLKSDISNTAHKVYLLIQVCVQYTFRKSITI